MGDRVAIEGNAAAALEALGAARGRALEAIGALAAAYAREGADFPGGTGRLRDSIGYEVAEGVVTIGSPVEYAPYVELGTGGLYEMPPEWMENRGRRGKGGGVDRAPRPFLRPAVEEHLEAYRQIIEDALRDAEA